jgi:hypothetical protein
MPPYISELVPQNNSAPGWLCQFLALRDVSHYLVGASVQYAANRDTTDARLQSACASSRNAVLNAVDKLRLPSHLSRMEMVATFGTIFRISLPDTPDVMRSESSEPSNDDYEFDALDSFATRLAQRQLVHRVSDREMMHTVSQAMQNILLWDGSSGQSRTTRPALYVMNCSECHLAGDSELRSSGLKLPVSHRC